MSNILPFTLRDAPRTAPESITVIRLPPGPALGRPCWSES